MEAALPLSQEEQFLRVYLEAQVAGLCELLMRSAGSSAAGKCERLLKDLAEIRGWDVAVSEGEVTYGGPLPSLEAYVDLIEHFVESAIKLLGLKLVIAEMTGIDENVDPEARHAADRVGMTTSFIRHL